VIVYRGNRDGGMVGEKEGYGEEVFGER